jgi:hypothetical protein
VLGAPRRCIREHYISKRVSLASGWQTQILNRLAKDQCCVAAIEYALSAGGIHWSLLRTFSAWQNARRELSAHAPYCQRLGPNMRDSFNRRLYARLYARRRKANPAYRKRVIEQQRRWRSNWRRLINPVEKSPPVPSSRRADP